MPERRRLVTAACIAVLVCATASLRAQQVDAPIRWVVPFPPGGGSDMVTRIVARRFAEKLGRVVVVENKPGAATAIAAQEVAKSRADGNTILTAGMSTLTLNPALYPGLPYRPDRDFAQVTTLVRLPVALVAGPAVKAASLKELVAWLRQRGANASYGSTGAGTPQHVAMALWLDNLALSTMHIPYKGVPQALQDLAGGQFDFMFADIGASVPLIRAGKLRALAVPSRARHPLLPVVPTFAEAGFAFEAAAWQGVVLPAGAPAGLVEHYSATIRGILAEGAILEQMQHHGMEPMGSTPDEFVRYVATERERWTRIIQSRKIGAE